MLESLVASILNRVLGSYVENFDPKKLQIGLLSGDVKLSGLKLKRGALDQLRLPINVTDGHIGSLVLQIPYSNLKSKPVKVFIEDVFLIATPDEGYDSKAQERRENSAKIEKLELWELSSERAMNRTSQGKSTDGNNENEQQQNFTSSLVTKIIDNLQVTIRNIHIRLEDSEAGVAIGATLGELSAISTNKDWEPAFIADIGVTTHKLATLDSLAFYIDPDLETEFSSPSTFEERQELLEEFKSRIFDSVGATDVLRPINGQGFITLNKSPSSDLVPKIQADLKFEELSVNLDRDQYIDSIKLIDHFQKYFKNLKYRRERPKLPVKEAPLDWFRYAAKTVLAGIHEKNRRWTWEYMRERLDDQRTYVDLYKKWYYAGGSTSGLSASEKTTFNEIQSKYSYEDLVFFRSLAKKDVVTERATHHGPPKSGSSQTWSEWLWGSKDDRGSSNNGKSISPNSSASAEKDADMSAPLEITDEQRRELLDVLDVTNLSQDSASQILLSLQFSLRSAGVRLKSGGLSLASAGFDSVKAAFVRRPDSFLVEMSIGKLAVSDLTHKNQFSEVICVQNLGKNLSKNDTEKASPLFWLLFEHHPADHKADSNLFLKSQSVVFIHNARLVESVVRFFNVPPDQGDTVDAILLAANRTVEDLREQTRIGLEYALENHKTLNLQLDIKAPTIIIPLDPEADDSPVALLDVGSLQMSSELVPPTVLNEVKSKQALKYTAEDWKRLESLMYDRFKIELLDTQILLALSMEEIKDALGKSSSKYHFLDKTTLQFLVELSIVPTNHSLTRSRISIKLPNLRATLADVQYMLFMRILAAATPKVTDLDNRVQDVAEKEKQENERDDLSETESKTKDKDKKSANKQKEPVRSTTPPSPQKIFEFVFIVNEVRFLVVSGWKAKPLVDMCLHDFAVSCWSISNHPDESFAVDLSVRDLLITDHTSNNLPTNYKKIAESDGHQSDTKSESKLFSVNFRKAISGCMRVKINLEAIKFGFNPDTVLAIYDYIMSTFTSPQDNCGPNNRDSQTKDTGSISAPEKPALPTKENATSGPAFTSRIDVEMNMSRVSALLMDDQLGIVTMSLESATLSASLTNRLQTQLKLGAVSIVNMAKEPVLSIDEGAELADFRYETQPMKEDGITPSGPSLVYLRMGRVKLSMLEDPLTRIVGFLMRFTAMKAVYDQSRMMAFNQAIQVEPGMFKFDLVVSTPIIVWSQGPDWIRLNLGEVFLQNSFDDTKNTAKCGIRHVQVTTLLSDKENEVVPKTDLSLKMVYTPDSADTKLPLTVVDAHLSPVHVEASEIQYHFIKQFIAVLSRISAGTASAHPDIEEVGNFRRQLAKEKKIGEKQTSYWWGENFSVNLGDNSNGKNVSRPKVNLKFAAPSFDITLNLEENPLARFAIKDVALDVDMNSKSELESNFHIRFFSAEDLTGSGQNKFPTIIPPIKHDGYQVMGRVLQRQKEPLNIECSIDSPQVVVALEYMMLLRTYLDYGSSKDLESNSESSESDPNDDDSDQSYTSDDDSSIETRLIEDSSVTDSHSSVNVSENARKRAALIPKISVNIVDMYLTVLSNEKDEDSEAIVFKIDQLILNTGDTSSLTLSKVGMFLTRMQSFEASRLRILDDFNVTASLDNSESTENLRLSNIQANMERLVLRISLREIGLILSILSKASTIYNSGQKKSPKRKVDISHNNKKATNFFADDHRVARPRARSLGYTDGDSESLSQVRETITSARVLSEQLTAQFEDVRVVLIDPVHQLPLTDFCIKPFTLVAENWSDSLIVTAKAELFANVHSFTKSVWEPLVDIMELGLTVTGEAFEIYSTTVADIELTPETLELIHDIRSYFADSSQETFQRKYHHDDGAPYRIRNETGFDITIWSDSVGTSTPRRRIHDGQQIGWSFHAWRELRENLNATDQDNKVGLEIHSQGYEPLRSIPVNSVGEHLYVTNHNGEKVRIVFDIWIENHLKFISIRSTTVLRNHTETPLEILMMHVDGNHREVLELPSHSAKPLPLNFLDSRLLIRKVGDSQWSNKEIYWKTLLSGDMMTLTCSENFALSVNPEIPDDPLSQHYPYLYINFSVPFVIVNNLPLDISLRLYSRDLRKESQRDVPKAGRAFIHDYNSNNLLLMRVDIDGYTSNKFAVINTGGRFTHEFHNEDYLEVSRDRQRLHLLIEYVDLPQGEGRVIVIYTPYIVINSTGQEFMLSGNLNRVICPPEAATLWSSGGINNNDAHQKITFTAKGSHASSPVSLDASGSNSEISLLSKDRQRELFLGVSITPMAGRYVNTKAVTISPRFILCNSMDRPLEFREPGGRSPFKAEPGERVSVNYMWTMASKEICVKFGDSEKAEWSSGFAMANVGKIYVRMIDRGKPTVLARAEVILEGAVFFVHLTLAKSWPYSIRNFTDREFIFYQTDPLVDEDGAELLNHSKDEFSPLRYRLPPRSAMPYSWDFPAATVKQLVLEPVAPTDAPGEAPTLPDRRQDRPGSSAASVAESAVSYRSNNTFSSSTQSLARQGQSRGFRVRRRIVQLAEIGELPPANFGGGVVVDLSVIADGPQQALVIAPHNPDASTYDAVTNRVKSEAVAEAEAVESQSGRALRLNLKGIGISCITPQSRELVYITLRNIKVNYHVSDALETIALQIQWIQVDNSLAGSSDFPVVIYPTVLPKAAAELAAHPCFSASLTRVRDDSYGVAYIKHATLLLQELTIEADEDFLLGVAELVVSLTTNKGAAGPHHHRPYMPLLDDNSVLCGEKIHVPEPSGDTTPDIYFEQLHLQPIQLNLSFVRTGSLSSSAIFKDNNAAGNLAFIIDALTLTIGNINDAPLRFNALLVDNVRTQSANLLKMIQMHYQQEFLYQLHKLLGSADIIGNPVGLFNNISSGVMDLFYEPYLGYTLNDRPHEFGIGLAKGGLSFMKKSVFGVSDSISKVTGSLSKGLSAVTMDQRYQNQRRVRRTRNRPKHAIYGVKYGFESLYESLSSGVLGLAEAPMQGAITDGSAGFIKGLGIGLLGLPTKTTIGLLDMASNISEGIRNTTTVFDTHEISRVRLPRVISSDGVVRPYNVRESVGQMILHTVVDGKYAKYHYLAHSNITRNKVVVVSLELVLVANINDMTLEWSLSYDQIQAITNESTGISITLIGGSHGPFIPLSEDSARQIIYSNIAKGVDAHNRRQLVEAD